jgi:hypothetical protein
MNSMRWMFLAATLLSISACKKESPAVDSPPPVTEPAAAKSAESPDPVAPDQGTAPTATPGEPMGAVMGDEIGEKPPANPSRDMVAVSSAGKDKVIATGTKTVADTDAYTVKLASPDKVAVGSKGSATLEITPKKGWHLNDEFPYKLTVTAPAGAKVAKPEQGKKDTVSFSHEKMKWAIDFEASAAGDKAFTGKVKFAVCTETSCDPKKEELAFNVKVQ